MKYDISFDTKNSNCIIIKEEGKIINYIACPPIDKGCDIFSFDSKLYPGYTYDFDGLVLITSEEKRELYYKGDLVASTKRIKNEH